MDTEEKIRRSTASRRPGNKLNSSRTAEKKRAGNKAARNGAVNSPEGKNSRNHSTQRQTQQKKSTTTHRGSPKQIQQERNFRAASRNTPRKRSRKPDVIYTPPKPFSRNRFLLRLATVVAAVLALTFVLSVFFKVKTVTVSGAGMYSPYEVMEASGIEKGDNLLSISKAKVYAKIKVALPYVDQVRLGIKLPDTVNIGIVERDVVYAVQAQDMTWWLITGEGEVVEKTNSAVAGEHIQIKGVRLDSPKQGKMAVPLSNIPAPAETKPEQSSEAAEGFSAPSETVMPAAVTAEQSLKIALEIVGSLKKYGLADKIASVDVSNVNAITVWYGTRFEVQLGDSSQTDFKIQCLQQTAEQMKPHQSGILDISFTLRPNEVVYTPFA